MKKRATVKFHLALKNKTLKQLAEHLEITPDGLYKKLNGARSIKDSEIKEINKYLGLSELESDNLWR